MEKRKQWTKEARARHLAACQEYAGRQKVTKIIFHIIENGSAKQKKRLFEIMRSALLKAGREKQAINDFIKTAQAAAY